MQRLLGSVANQQMTLSNMGKVALKGFQRTLAHFPTIEIPGSCIMPNHIHFITFVTDIGRGGVSPPSYPKGEVTSPLPKVALGKIVAFYKYHTTKEINALWSTPGSRFWQRNYYERVIRNEHEFEAIHDYIETNPLNWERDEYYSNERFRRS